MDWEKEYNGCAIMLGVEKGRVIVLKKSFEIMEECLEIIAAQSSGKAGSTKKSDCMAELARVTLRRVLYIGEELE